MKRKFVSANQIKLFAKQKETKQIRKDTGETDALNLRSAEYFISKRAVYGEDSIQIVYSKLVMERLKP